MNFFTDFADQAVVLPMVFAIALTLLALRWRRGAFAWIVAVGCTLSVMLALKLIFLACGGMIPDADIRTPSGHTAAAAVVAGGLTALSGIRPGNKMKVVLVTALGAAVAFGLSRLILGAHTVAEVIIGGFVGSAGAGLLVWLAGPPPESLRAERLAAVAMAVLILFHGFHLPAEAKIYRAASLLRTWPLSACQLSLDP